MKICSNMLWCLFPFGDVVWNRGFRFRTLPPPSDFRVLPTLYFVKLLGLVWWSVGSWFGLWVMSSIKNSNLGCWQGEDVSCGNLFFQQCFFCGFLWVNKNVTEWKKIPKAKQVEDNYKEGNTVTFIYGKVWVTGLQITKQWLGRESFPLVSHTIE